MEKIDRQVFLYDFYGELLTEHQRQVYEDAVLNDMSLGEIAGELSISRQGVHDLIRRCDKLLEGYEEKLHLFERFRQTRQQVEEIRKLAVDCPADAQEDHLEKIAAIAAALSEEL
ncbi:MAG: YlxM family DNA-binding protein [Eubacterium sp.]|nr:YlxM family DNA-binding protein [Eubacterium sp.]MBQ9023170.1 YlxM family DNA-binding protein [Eubacterium sp.]